MIELVAALCGALIVAGIIGAVLAARPIPDDRATRPTGPRFGGIRNRVRISRRSRILLIVGTAVGLAVAAFTGWMIAIIIVPAAMVGIPYLLGAPPTGARIEKLDALEDWTRSLSGLLVTGAGLEEAITLTLRSVPDPIRPEVTNLVARLRARMTPEAALRAFADDINDETGDRTAAYLIIAAKRRGGGLTTVLESLAASVAADVSARRQLENEHKKPRTTVRSVTAITATLLGLLAFTGEYVAPYTTPIGGTVLITLLTLYAACLLWLRRMSTTPPFPRFLGATARQEPQQP